MHRIAAIAVIAFIAALILIGGMNSGRRHGTIDCARVKPSIAGVMESWREVGVIRGERPDKLEVDDIKWKAAAHDGKVSIALAGFCAANPSGIGYFPVWGYSSGDILASVTDGNYFD